ncbi:MAG: bL21 family ribosomal protein, partial [Alphaproteobacteria bacterium]|nr:bL21 family ribosomal protein [Alphaproteobacteria bacterium]
MVFSTKDFCPWGKNRRQKIGKRAFQLVRSDPQCYDHFKQSGANMYAVISSGGKQYRVEANQELTV